MIPMLTLTLQRFNWIKRSKYPFKFLKVLKIRAHSPVSVNWKMSLGTIASA